jgi:hypothetical protein
MIKVIFLDIDGVLNCNSTPNPRRFPYIVDATLLLRFQSLVGRTGATVVLAATWRYDPVGLLAARHHGIPFRPTWNAAANCRWSSNKKCAALTNTSRPTNI